jgi:hypothetical protein
MVFMHAPKMEIGGGHGNLPAALLCAATKEVSRKIAPAPFATANERGTEKRREFTACC